MQLTRKKILLLLFCSTCSIGLVTIIFKYSQNINHRNNNFTRIFPPHLISNPKQLELTYNSFYLAGFSKTNIFLGNSTGPAFLLNTNYDLTDSNHIILKVSPDIPIVAPAIKVIVDSPDIYIMEGLTPRILHGTLNNSYLTDCGFNTITFNTSCNISNQSFAIRTYDTSLEQNILAKSSANTNITQRFPGILTKRGDGIFSLDGKLVQDETTHHLVYVYYYRNEFIYMDSNLHVLLKGKTIDSIHTPQIKLSRIISTETTTFSVPPLMVNKTSCAHSDFLFVNSGLRAKNENEEDFAGNSVVDIYTLKNGEYLFSFYVPDHHHIKMKSFQVFNHRLVALYDHSLMTFSMQF